MKHYASRAVVGVDVEKEKFVETHQLSEQTGKSNTKPKNVARFVQSLLSDDAVSDQQIERQTDGHKTNVRNWQRW